MLNQKSCSVGTPFILPSRHELRGYEYDMQRVNREAFEFLIAISLK